MDLTRNHLITPNDVAQAVGCTENRLWRIARNIEDYYYPTRIQRGGKKSRPLDVPKKPLMNLHRKLHAWFQKKKCFHNSAHGGVRGRSCFSSARRHLGKRFVCTRDAKDCYPSISPSAIKHELSKIGFRTDTAQLLSLLCTVRGGLPQGSPTSGDILNLFLYRMDQTLSSKAGSWGVAYSRFADDFVCSGKSRQNTERVAESMESALREKGIDVNAKKKRASGYQPCHVRQHVHSIHVNSRSDTNICQEHRDKILKLAERYWSACKSVQPESLPRLAKLRDSLRGWLYYCRQADKSPAREIKRILDRGDRRVRNRLKRFGLSAHKNKWWLVSSKRNEPRHLAIAWQRQIDKQESADAHFAAAAGS